MNKYKDKQCFKAADTEKKRLSIGFRRFITFQTNHEEIRDLLGVDVFEVRSWIESNFIEGMSWDNYGTIWVVDHIVPFRLFDIFNPEDMKICWHYKNLMPLFKKDNEKKSGNVFFAFELLHELKDKDYFFLQLYKRVKTEVEWMSTYIDTYHKKYAVNE
jgi:hypothetical protein